MTYQATVLADSPVGYWRLDDTSGTTVVDSSGHANNGTYQGAFTLNAAGVIPGDSAVQLAGAGTISLPALGLSPPFTLECWVNPSGDLGTSRGFAALLGSGGASRILWNDSSAQILVQMGGPSLTTTSFVPQGSWSHVVYVADGVNETVYVNGAQAAQQANAAASWASAFFAGTYAAVGGAYQIIGSLDEIAVYPTALAAGRVLAHYTAGAPSLPAGGTLTLSKATVNYPVGTLYNIPYGGNEAITAGFFTAFPLPWSAQSSDPGIQISVTNGSVSAPIAPILMDAYVSSVDSTIYYSTFVELSTVQPGGSITETVAGLPVTQMRLALPYLAIENADVTAGWSVSVSAKAV